MKKHKTSFYDRKSERKMMKFGSKWFFGQIASKNQFWKPIQQKNKASSSTESPAVACQSFVPRKCWSAPSILLWWFRGLLNKINFTVLVSRQKFVSHLTRRSNRLQIKYSGVSHTLISTNMPNCIKIIDVNWFGTILTGPGLVVKYNVFGAVLLSHLAYL